MSPCHASIHNLKTWVCTQKASSVQLFHLRSTSSCAQQPLPSELPEGQPIYGASTVCIGAPELLSHTTNKTPTGDPTSFVNSLPPLPSSRGIRRRSTVSPPRQELHLQCTDSHLSIHLFFDYHRVLVENCSLASLGNWFETAVSLLFLTTGDLWGIR